MNGDASQSVSNALYFVALLAALLALSPDMRPVAGVVAGLAFLTAHALCKSELRREDKPTD